MVMKKKSVVVYGHVKNFDCGEIFGGASIFLTCDFSWNDELNFRVAETQE